MEKTIFSLIILLSAWTVPAQTTIDLWPDGIPGDNGLTEIALEDGTYRLVTHPVLELFLPDPSRANGQALVICPGGSYYGLAFNHEGRDVARWINERGTTALVLKYRMPGGHDFIPRADVQRAVETVRENAAEWNIDPSKVGVIGFSAGGHLASTALTHFTTAENRPDFGILVYPVISMKDELTHFDSRRNLTGASSYTPLLDEFSSETRVTAQTPQVLILYSHDDDVVDVRNGVVFYEACLAAGVPAEMHIYPSGGHGWGWSEGFRYSGEMKSTVARWLSERE